MNKVHDYKPVQLNSFRPKINRRSKQMVQVREEPVEDLLLKKGEEYKQKQQRQEMKKVEEEVVEPPKRKSRKFK